MRNEETRVGGPVQVADREQTASRCPEWKTLQTFITSGAALPHSHLDSKTAADKKGRVVFI